MDAALTAEQDEIRRTLREIVTKRCGPDDVKAAVRTPAGYDAGLWAALAGQLGLPGLALPERHGGTGCGTLELALACEELGQGLAPSPLIATAGLAMPLLLGRFLAAQRKVSWGLFAIGAATFILSQIGHVPFNLVVQPMIGRATAARVVGSYSSR